MSINTGNLNDMLAEGVDPPTCSSSSLPRSLNAFRSWLSRAKPGEWFEYHRGLLAVDRDKARSSLKEPERRKLAALAHHALALADGGKLHLLQERHGDSDYSYWAVARTPAGSNKPVRAAFRATTPSTAWAP